MTIDLFKFSQHLQLPSRHQFTIYALLHKRSQIPSEDIHSSPLLHSSTFTFFIQSSLPQKTPTKKPHPSLPTPHPLAPNSQSSSRALRHLAHPAPDFDPGDPSRLLPEAPESADSREEKSGRAHRFVYRSRKIRADRWENRSETGRGWFFRNVATISHLVSQDFCLWPKRRVG